MYIYMFNVCAYTIIELLSVLLHCNHANQPEALVKNVVVACLPGPCVGLCVCLWLFAAKGVVVQ